MELLFSSKTLERCCTERVAACAKWGTERAAVIQRRLVQLDAAQDLSVIASLPGAGFQLRKAGRRTIYAVDALDPFEIVFEPLSKDGAELTEAVEFKAIKKIKLTSIETRHGR